MQQLPIFFCIKKKYFLYENSGEKHPMFGRILSEEIRAKMRAAKLGQNHFGYGKVWRMNTKLRLRLLNIIFKKFPF